MLVCEYAQGNDTHRCRVLDLRAAGRRSEPMHGHQRLDVPVPDEQDWAHLPDR
jgi:hypothetical protein